MGFQHMPEVVRQAAQRKGGKVQKRKGLAKLPLYRRQEIASMGGKARHDDNSRKGTKQTQVPQGAGVPNLDDLFGDLDNDSDTRTDS